MVKAVVYYLFFTFFLIQITAMNETLQIVLQILTAITGILVIVKQFITDKKITVVDTKVTVVDTKVKEAVEKVSDVDSKVKDAVDKVSVVDNKLNEVSSKVDGVNVAQREVQKELNGRLEEFIDLTKKASLAEGDLQARAQIKSDAESEENKPEYMIKKLLDELKQTMQDAIKSSNPAHEAPAKVEIVQGEDNPAPVHVVEKKK